MNSLSKTAKPSTDAYDVIVVGAGHNGLICAAFLAKAGKRVLVVEARDVVGGLCWTMEMPHAQGFFVNPCCVEFVMTNVKPTVHDQLELHRYGLRWLEPVALTTWLGPNGSRVVFYQDIEKTKREIARYSQKDAVRYGELVEVISGLLEVMLPYLQGHPTRVRPGVIWEVIKKAVRGRRHLMKGARVLLSSIDQVLDEWFECEEVKAPIAAYCAGNLGPITEPGSGFHLAFLCGIHHWGHKRPVGGSGAYTQAIAAALKAHGGEIRTGIKVKRVSTNGGQATGVILENDEKLLAKEVVCAVDPTTLLTKLLDPADVPMEAKEQINALQNGRYNVLYFDINVALSGRPKFPNYEGNDEDLSTLMLCPTMDYMRRSTLDGMAGNFTAEIPMAVISSSVYDRSLVPPGSSGDTLKFYCFNTPIKLSEGRSWEDEKMVYYNRVMDHFEQYAPGTRDLVLDIHLTAPPDFESRYHIHRGNYEHADLTLTQMGPFRPIPALAGYRTPIKNLWHTGAGAFPFAYMNGWPGRTTAQTILRGNSWFK